MGPQKKSGSWNLRGGRIDGGLVEAVGNREFDRLEEVALMPCGYIVLNTCS